MTARKLSEKNTESSCIDGCSEAEFPEYICRNGERISTKDIYDRIMAGTLEADEECLSMLEDFFCAWLAGCGKISKEDFERWRNPRELYWEGQIALLMTDEEYGKKYVDWDYIRAEAEPHEWLSFLMDLPQYADEADWEKLVLEGSPQSWQRLFEVRPELQEKYRLERMKHEKKMNCKGKRRPNRF